MSAKPAFIRSDGVTESERYLKHLCERSFLSLWSYPGIHNDKGPGQEVCDMLVVFENHVIIFSDKHCEFPNSGDVNLDWERWYRRAIAESAVQVFGAERWITEHPNRLFLDQACKIKFPISLPSANEAKFHRVVVTHASSDRCKQHFGGESGSLLFASTCHGDSTPFTIGHVAPSKGIVHILDDTSLDIILGTLDTISDFIEYLEKKEEFLSQGIPISAAGEEEFLALYLQNDHSFGMRDDLENFGAIALLEGGWKEFSTSQKRKVQVEANKISYFWDGLIENFTHHFVEGTLEFTTESTFDDQERVLRLLAKEDRTRRRMLSTSFFEFLHKNNFPRMKASRISVPLEEGEPLYLFLVVPNSRELFPAQEYREFRQKLLISHCAIAKLQYPTALDIIGIATETGRIDAGSEDLAYLNTRDWNDQHRRDAEKTLKFFTKHKIYGPGQPFGKVTHEYPESSLPPPSIIPGKFSTKGNMRNRVCPCGSGRKYKKCHGATA